MTKLEFISAAQNATPNASFMEVLKCKYGVSFPETIGRILSVLPQGGFLEGDDFCRVMSSSEIVSANETLHTDFAGKKLLPILDLGDNVFVVFDFSRHDFGRFSLNDELIYWRSEKLNDILERDVP